MMYHLRTLAVGACVLTVIVFVIYLMTLLPLWLAETPFVLWIAYVLGKLAEAWARK